jgi:F-type H+-transporting ATPase subunit epsilon
MEPVLRPDSDIHLEGDAPSSPALRNLGLMHLKILLPFEIFAEKNGVKRIIAETSAGSFGLLPHRLDCTAALVPGILIFETVDDGEVYMAVAEGALTKTGLAVVVSVRNAIAGRDLRKLREAVEQEFKNLDERERTVRSVLAKLESGFIRRFLEFQHG